MTARGEPSDEAVARVRADLRRLGPRPPSRDVLHDAAGDDAGRVIAEQVIADWKYGAKALGWQSSPNGPIPVLTPRAHVWRTSAQYAGTYCQCCMGAQRAGAETACTGRPFARLVDRGPPLEVQAIVTAMLRGVRYVPDGSTPRIPLPLAPVTGESSSGT